MEQLEFKLEFMHDIFKDLENERHEVDQLLIELDALTLEIDKIINRRTPWED